MRRSGGSIGRSGSSGSFRPSGGGIRQGGGSSGIRRSGGSSGFPSGGSTRRSTGNRTGGSGRSGISGNIRNSISGRTGGSSRGYWNFPQGGNRGGSNRGSLNRGSSIRGGSIRGGSSFRGGSNRGGLNIVGRSPFRSRWQVWGNRGSGYRRGLRSSWGFWLSNGYNGWGLGIGVGRGYFGYNYSFPIGNYYNPYYYPVDYFPVVEQQYFDYSQPLTGQSAPTDPGVEAMALADDAFRNGDFKTALTAVDNAARLMPQNADVHQFRSLVLVALERYRESAAAAHAALVVGRGWNWDTLRSFYPTKEDYTAHLRAIEEYRSDDKTNAVGRFLLGYHYMMLGHSDAAGKELAAAVALEPSDRLSAELLSGITRTTGKQYVYEPPVQSVPVESGVKQPPPPPLPAKKTAGPQLIRTAKPTMTGSWKASRADGTTVTLRLLNDGKFEWTASKAGRTTTLAGTYTLKDGELKLVSSKGKKTLEGKLTPAGDGRFDLKLKWQDPQEAGLSFQRQP